MSVYDAHAGDLRPLVARFFASPFEREEAVQEIWLHVHRVAASYAPERGPLLPWLRVLAANRCRELLRAKGRRPNPSQEVDDDQLLARESPEEEARRRRLRAAIDDFVGSLDAEETDVFRLALMEEREHAEVAALLGLSPRRCKYLKLKLLARAAVTPGLRHALEELKEP